VAFQSIADIAWTKAKQRLQYKVNDDLVATLGARVRVQTIVALLANVSTSAQLVTRAKLDALIETLLRRFVQQHKEGYRGKLITVSAIKRDAVRIRRMLYDNAAPIPDAAAAAATTTTATPATSSASAVKVKVKKPARKRLKRDEEDDDEDDEDDLDDIDEDEDLDEDEDEEAEDEDEEENDDVDDGDLDVDDVQHEDDDDDDVAEDEADHDDEEQQRRTIHVITDDKRTEFEK